MVVLNFFRTLPILAVLSVLAIPLQAQLPNVVLPAPTAEIGMRLIPVPDTIVLFPPAPPLLSSPGEETSRLSSLVTIGSVADDRNRLAQIRGQEPTGGYLIRSPSSQTPDLRGSPEQLRWALLLPEFRTVINTDIPFSLNEDGLWAGSGTNARLMTGVRAQYGPLSLNFAPQLNFHANNWFPIPALPVADRHPHSSRWHSGRDGNESADLPHRFGDQQITTGHLGHSALWLDIGQIALGAATEGQWWGPGIRSAIVMSNNAPGIPHLFLRSAAPIVTRFGAFEGKWMVGALTESAYFDTLAANDTRSLSAVAATFRPAAEPNLTLGLARAVYAPAQSVGAAALRLFDVFVRSGRYRGKEGPDQLISLFGRWVFPDNGAEIYAEWARAELPSSLRDLLSAPNHTQGYTLGLQWARPVRESTLVRLQAEITQLEQSPTYRQRPVTGWYTSRQVPQGYTQHGQVIGAATGPGSSSQWVAADFLRPGWGVGLVMGRIRWENDTYYRQALDGHRDGRHHQAHDVSLLGGVRAQYRLAWLEIGAELIHQNRMNYFFQNWSFDWDELPWDQPNTTVRLIVSPRVGGR